MGSGWAEAVGARMWRALIAGACVIGAVSLCLGVLIARVF